jgi:nucleotidyltransferase substrate binding protein (TIGR01987 family)
MSLNTEHLRRCIETLRSSMALYDESPAGSVHQEVYRNAIVKGYELSQETSFKLLKKALREYGHSTRTLDATPVKELLRLSATCGLMTIDEVERWFTYRDNRNSTAHDYGEMFARETLLLMPRFVEDVARLEVILRARHGGAEG